MKKALTLILLVVCTTAMKAQKEYDSTWVLQANDYNAEYVGAPMANGTIGLLPWREPLSVRQVTLNHVFDSDGLRGVSRVLRGLNPFVLTMTVDGQQLEDGDVSKWRQQIDMAEAIHRTSFVAQGKAAVECCVAALRNMPYGGIVRVKVTALKDISIDFENSIDIPDEYIESECRFRDIESDGIPMRLLQANAQSRYRKVCVAAESVFLLDKASGLLPETDESGRTATLHLTMKRGQTLSFDLVGVVCSSRDFIDPLNEAERQVIYAVSDGADRLIQAHKQLWQDLWKGDIVIDGDDEAQRAVRFALFNLYSSCREGSRLSISPMGLSSQGYNGHIFWDAETWMFTPMLLLNQGIARAMVDYRFDRLSAARRKAMAYGFKGAMYPWESDDAGEEATPTTALTGVLEHHITADVAQACWNYYCVTHNLQWLREEGWPILRDIADFWVSRATPNNDGSYSICNVVGADEYARGVDDDAFTNAAARLALTNAVCAAQLCGETARMEWSIVANGLRLLTFPDSTTREHASYNGEMIKQADVNLLGFPLCCINDSAILLRDMHYYIDKIDKRDGPAMSQAVLCVQYARLGRPQQAYDMFKRAYMPNLRSPFGVLAETATSQNPYFMTAAGGILQAVMCGFCGLQITENGIEQVPSTLPKHWRSVTVKGVGSERKTFVRRR